MSDLTGTMQIVIEAVAVTDAQELPLRGRFRQRRAQVRRERRQKFRAAGIDLVGGGTASERMAYARQIEAAELAGLITVAREAGKRAGVRLTMLGDTIARTLVARPTVAETWGQFEAACDLDRRAFGRGLPEHIYFGLDRWPNTPEAVTEAFEAIKALESNLRQGD